MTNGKIKITIDPFKSITAFLGMLVWIGGLILANGFWSTFFAFIFPPWGWYLVVEAILIRTGVI